MKEGKLAECFLSTQEKLKYQEEMINHLKLENLSLRMKCSHEDLNLVSLNERQKSLSTQGTLQPQGEVTKFNKGSSASAALRSRIKELERKVELMQKSRAMSPAKKTALSSSREEKLTARIVECENVLAKAQELDLAFLVDGTASMQGFIDTVKELVPTIAAGVKKAWRQLKLRVAFAPYRDYEDASRDDAETCDFTDDFTKTGSVFVQALSRVRAEGGDDDAEDVFTGLERVASLGWKSRTRLLVHIADAPCHGAEFYDIVEGSRCTDWCPDGDFKGRSIQLLLDSLRDGCQIIRYLFCHVNNRTKKMVSVFKRECGEPNWIHEAYLSHVNNWPRVSPRRLPIVFYGVCKLVTAAVLSASMRSCLSRCRSHYGEISYSYLPNTCSTEKACVCRSPKTLGDLFSALSTNKPLDLEELPEISVQISKDPFSAEGALRWPYHALVEQNDAYVNQPPIPPRPMVVKRFKTFFGEKASLVQSKEAYFEQMEVQTVAAKMAEHFNELFDGLSCPEYKAVLFTPVTTLRVGRKYYNMEPFLEGKWTRFSNNLSYVNKMAYAATLQAFSHWTYHRSNGLLMVNDLQGVEKVGESGSREFWLCDPSIHCKDALRYERTRTNWGEHGVKRFLEVHLCNSICRFLQLPTSKSALTSSEVILPLLRLPIRQNSHRRQFLEDADGKE